MMSNVKIEYGVPLVTGKLVDSLGDVTVYTVPSSIVSVVIDEAIISNITTTPISFDLWVVPIGKSTEDRFKRVVNFQIETSGSYLLPELVGAAISSGGTIVVNASIISGLTFSATGTEKKA